MASGRLPAGKSANKPAKKVLQALELFGGKKRMLIDEITVIAVELYVLGDHVQGVGITHRRIPFFVVASSIYGNPLTRAESDAPRP